MTPEEQKADFDRNLKFERRVVIFYDVLGWRGVTESTEGIPDRIGDLRRLVLLHSRILKLQAGGPADLLPLNAPDFR